MHKRPSDITIEDLNASFILDFLSYLEQERHNCIRSRNARFAAIRSFMEYVSFEEPSALALTQSVLAIPMKRFEQPLTGDEPEFCLRHCPSESKRRAAQARHP